MTFIVGSIWHGIKKTFGTTPVDDKEAEHKEGYTALIRELKQALNVKQNKQLSLTVLPNVNASSEYCSIVILEVAYHILQAGYTIIVIESSS